MLGLEDKALFTYRTNPRIQAMQISLCGLIDSGSGGEGVSHREISAGSFEPLGHRTISLFTAL